MIGQDRICALSHCIKADILHTIHFEETIKDFAVKKSQKNCKPK